MVTAHPFNVHLFVHGIISKKNFFIYLAVLNSVVVLYLLHSLLREFIRDKISNNIHCLLLNIANACPIFNDGFIKLSLKLRHWWVIAAYDFMWMQLSSYSELNAGIACIFVSKGGPSTYWFFYINMQGMRRAARAKMFLKDDKAL